MKSVRLEIAEATEGKLHWRMTIDGQGVLTGMCEIASPSDKTRVIACATEALANYHPLKEVSSIRVEATPESHLDDWMKDG